MRFGFVHIINSSRNISLHSKRYKHDRLVRDSHLVSILRISLLLGLIASWHYKKKAELDRKLMSVLREEFPDYNYNILKSEMHYVYAKHYRCPRCGGILERKDDLPKPIKCTKAGCNYPGK